MRWFSRILLLSVVFVLFGCSSANDEDISSTTNETNGTSPAGLSSSTSRRPTSNADVRIKAATFTNAASKLSKKFAAEAVRTKRKLKMAVQRVESTRIIVDRAISANKYAQKGYEVAKRNLKDKDLAEAAHKLLKATETTSKNAEEARNRSTLVIDSVEISIRMADDANSKMISANDLAERASEDADKANEAAQTPTDDFSMEEYKLARKEYEDSKQQASDAKTGYEREKEAFIVVKKQHDASWIDYERTKKDMEHAKISFEHAREDSKRPTSSKPPTSTSSSTELPPIPPPLGTEEPEEPEITDPANQVASRAPKKSDDGEAKQENGGINLTGLWVVMAIVAVLFVLAIIGGVIAGVIIRKKRMQKKKKAGEPKKADPELGGMAALDPIGGGGEIAGSLPPVPVAVRRPKSRGRKLNDEKRWTPVKQMEAGRIVKDKFAFEGRLNFDATGNHGPLVHATADQKSHSLRDVIFADEMNKVYDMGSEIEHVVLSEEHDKPKEEEKPTEKKKEAEKAMEKPKDEKKTKDEKKPKEKAKTEKSAPPGDPKSQTKPPPPK